METIRPQNHTTALSKDTTLSKKKKTSSKHSGKSTSSHLEFDKRISIRLKKLICSKNDMKIEVNIKKWILQFTKFRDKTGISKQRTAKVMTWYTKHFGEQYVPQAYSAQEFCDKFIRIENAMKRSVKKKQTDETGREDFEMETKRKGNIIEDVIHYENKNDE